jgi:hypothetical protein
MGVRKNIYDRAKAVRIDLLVDGNQRDLRHFALATTERWAAGAAGEVWLNGNYIWKAALAEVIFFA